MTLPGFHECEICGGQGGSPPRWHGPELADPWACPVCGGAGQVPDDDTVEAVAPAIYYCDFPTSSEEFGAFQADDFYRDLARAALLAYARHTQETKP